MTKFIEVTKLHKFFGKVHALNDVNLTVNQGEIFGFIGPNGAGKSTLIRILSGLLKKSSGSATVFCQPVFIRSQHINQKVAYIPGEITLWPNLSGGEIIDYLLKLRGQSHTARTDELIELFKLDPTKKARSYSKGNRQKVVIIAALSADADLFLFDEPTSGLDPLHERSFQNEILKLKQAGKTVLLSSHILSEVEKVVDHVGIIRDGHIIKQGSISDFSQLNSVNVKVTTTIPFVNPVNEVAVTNFHSLDYHRASFTIEKSNLNSLLKVLTNYQVINLETTQPQLEDVFINYYREQSANGER